MYIHTHKYKCIHIHTYVYIIQIGMIHKSRTISWIGVYFLQVGLFRQGNNMSGKTDTRKDSG